MDKDFDLLKIIRDIKYLKMLTRFHIKPEDELKIQIVHCLKNMIDLDGLLNEHGLHDKKSLIQTHLDRYKNDKVKFDDHF